MLVPASSVGVLGSVRGGAEGLEGHSIGLAGLVAIENSQHLSVRHRHIFKQQNMQLKVKKIRDAIARKWVLVKQRGLKPPHQHGPMFLIIKKQGGLNQKKATA